MTQPRIVASQRPAGVPSWKQVFITGLLLWFASLLVTGLTSNLNMIPTVILLGSFLVPATAVVWYLDHYQSELLDPWRSVGFDARDCAVPGDAADGYARDAARRRRRAAATSA